MLFSLRFTGLIRTLFITVASLTVLAMAPAMAHADTLEFCVKNISWKAANGKYLSAELNYGGPWNSLLRARPGFYVATAWETFTLVP